MLLLSVTVVAGAILISPLEHAASDALTTVTASKNLQFICFLRDSFDAENVAVNCYANIIVALGVCYVAACANCTECTGFEDSLKADNIPTDWQLSENSSKLNLSARL
ncbi:MAG: hypothetical protein DRR11_14275 [Gammaproteobacteria bacterium]|nr:MAG: hypothetical protein DRR11_14275 [Gammaproteobacteria bacterium]